MQPRKARISYVHGGKCWMVTHPSHTYGLGPSAMAYNAFRSLSLAIQYAFSWYAADREYMGKMARGEF